MTNGPAEQTGAGDESLAVGQGHPEGRSNADERSYSEKLRELYPNDAPGNEAEKPAAAAEAKSETQPDAYQLKMPEGVALDRDLLSEATPVLRDLGLSNDQASRLVPLAIRVQERIVDGLADEHSALKADWARATRNDPKIGGRNWKETERLAAIALNSGGAGPGSEVRELLNETGLGNHPAFVRLFRSLGYQLAAAKGKGGLQRSRAEILYPDDVRR